MNLWACTTRAKENIKMKHNKLQTLTRRYSDGGSNPAPTNSPETAPAAPQPQMQVPSEPVIQTPPNYEELFKTDKSLQSFIDKHVTRAVQTAVEKDRKRMQLLNDAAADEKSKLDVMTPEQREAYWRQKAETIQKDYEAKEAGRIAKQKATEIFQREKIPLELLELHDLSVFNDDFTSKLMNVYSKFEFYPKGEFDKALESRLNELRKQPTPETHEPQAKDPYAWQTEPEKAPQHSWNRHSK